MAAPTSGPCDAPVYVFSRIAGDTPAGPVAQPVNANVQAATCPVDGEDDFRKLTPGANQISVRYGVAAAENDKPLTAELDGLGFDDLKIKLYATMDGPGVYFYDSSYVDIPDGVLAAGALLVEVRVPGSDTVSSCYQTIGSNQAC